MPRHMRAPRFGVRQQRCRFRFYPLPGKRFSTPGGGRFDRRAGSLPLLCSPRLLGGEGGPHPAHLPAGAGRVRGSKLWRIKPTSRHLTPFVGTRHEVDSTSGVGRHEAYPYAVCGIAILAMSPSRAGCPCHAICASRAFGLSAWAFGPPNLMKMAPNGAFSRLRQQRCRFASRKRASGGSS